MTYQYDRDPDEAAAEALLKERGWDVNAPRCPDCKGWGYTLTASTWGTDAFGGGSIDNRPCPRGCPTLAMYL